MAINSADMRHDTHSTTVQGSWSTRRIAITALLCALAAIATLFLEFPILPGFDFLKYDPSGIIALIAGFSFGPATGLIVSTIPYLVHLATQSGIYGTIMAIICTVALVLPASLIYKYNTTRTGAIVGLVVGSLISIGFAILANLVVTPIYTGWPVEEVKAIVLPALLPFNAIKVAINSIVTAFIYKPITKAIIRES